MYKISYLHPITTSDYIMIMNILGCIFNTLVDKMARQILVVFKFVLTSKFLIGSKQHSLQ